VTATRVCRGIRDRPEFTLRITGRTGKPPIRRPMTEFAPSSAGDGTEVKVSLKYAPPGGRLGFAVTRFFGDNPSREVAGCLLLFKDFMETGDHGGTGARLPDAA
jgi:hypothetical protein